MTQSQREHWNILWAYNKRMEACLRYDNYRMYHAYIRAKMYYIAEHRRITGEV